MDTLGILAEIMKMLGKDERLEVYNLSFTVYDLEKGTEDDFDTLEEVHHFLKTRTTGGREYD